MGHSTILVFEEAFKFPLTSSYGSVATFTSGIHHSMSSTTNTNSLFVCNTQQVSSTTTSEDCSLEFILTAAIEDVITTLFTNEVLAHALRKFSPNTKPNAAKSNGAPPRDFLNASASAKVTPLNVGGAFWLWSEEYFHGAKMMTLDGELVAFMGDATEALTIGANAACIANNINSFSSL
eukprot:Gb_15984 [translate_table: standard]